MNVFLITWHAMRWAAYERHRFIHVYMEDSDPDKWPQHERIIKKVYGY